MHTQVVCTRVKYTCIELFRKHVRPIGDLESTGYYLWRPESLEMRL